MYNHRVLEGHTQLKPLCALTYVLRSFVQVSAAESAVSDAKSLAIREIAKATSVWSAARGAVDSTIQNAVVVSGAVVSEARDRINSAAAVAGNVVGKVQAAADKAVQTANLVAAGAEDAYKNSLAAIEQTANQVAQGVDQGIELLIKCEANVGVDVHMHAFAHAQFALFVIFLFWSLCFLFSVVRVSRDRERPSSFPYHRSPGVSHVLARLRV